jgi:hypothetical protein
MKCNVMIDIDFKKEKDAFQTYNMQVLKAGSS